MDISHARTALVTSDGGLRDFMARTLRDMDGAPKIGQELFAPFDHIGKEELERLREFDPELVILDVGADPVVGIRFGQFLVESSPNIRLIAVGPALSQELLLEAMRAGFAEYLPRPVEPTDVEGALERVARRMNRGVRADVREPGKVYALFSPKGGTGSTTLATNLAVQIHRLTGQKTLLVDLDLELGETALLLGVRPRFNFVDMVRNFHRMDTELLASYIERHESGLHLLSAPLRPDRIEEVGSDQVRSVLDFLRAHYDYLILDTSKSFGPATLAAVEEADLILLLTTPDLPSLRNAKRSIPLLEQTSGRRGKRVKLVVNRYNASSVITPDDVRTTLDTDIFWTLSNDYQAISASVNAGRPIVLNGSRSKYATDLKGLAATLTGRESGEQRRHSGLGPLVAPLRRIFGGNHVGVTEEEHGNE